MNADGSGQVNLTSNAAIDTEPAWSPDGTKIAFDSRARRQPRDLRDERRRRGPVNRTNSAVDRRGPAWSPDGTKIAFTSQRDGNDEIYVMNADGTGQVNLTNNAADDDSPAWSPDGTRIAFAARATATRDLLDERRRQRPARLTNNAASTSSPRGRPTARRSPSSHARRQLRDLRDEPGRLRTGEHHEQQRRRARPRLGDRGRPERRRVGNTTLQLNRATVQGTLAETGPGTGQFRAGPGQQVYVGGFDLRPRPWAAACSWTRTRTRSPPRAPACRCSSDASRCPWP